MKNLFLLPTNKPSRLIKSQDNDFVYLNTNAPNWFENNLKTIKQNLYITSDEKIKEGDWVIYTNGIKIHCKKLDNKEDVELANIENSGVLKIILTTDQDLILDGVQPIPDEFLEWFVKNPSCEFIRVGLEIWNDGNHNPIIIIPKEEPKQECNCDNTCDKCEEQESIQILKKAKENALKQETLENIKCTCLRPQVNCFSGMCSYCNRQIVKQLTTEDLKPKQGSMAEAIKQVVSNELKQETLEEVAENYFNNFTKRKEEFAFIDGAKWQQEQIYNKIKELYDNENITGFSKRAYAQCLDIVKEFKNK
jgi:hypothetical protein